MKARDLIGRRIVGVVQSRRYRDDTRSFAGMETEALILDNGSRVVFSTIETGHGYATEAIVAKPRRGARRESK